MLHFDLNESKKIVLVGDLAKVENIGDHGSSQVNKEDLAYYDEAAAGWKQEDITYIANIGNNADDAGKTQIRFQYGTVVE